MKLDASGDVQILKKILDSLAPGLTRNAQLEVLFQSYELGPDIFETRIKSLGSRQREQLLASLRLARDYCLYREQASQASRLAHQRAFPWNLVRSMDPSIRTDAREWLGFWALSRQGTWSELQWVERGVRTHVNFEAAELFARCLPLRPRALVLVHNHPSGRTEPSWIDLQLTRRVGTLASHLGIELKGHWIVGPQNETWIPLNPAEPHPVTDAESPRHSASAHGPDPSPLEGKSSSFSTPRNLTRISEARGLRSSPSKEPG
jgi:DNA repair protein RadC